MTLAPQSVPPEPDRPAYAAWVGGGVAVLVIAVVVAYAMM